MRVTPAGLWAALCAAATLLAQPTAAQTPPPLNGPVTIYVAGTAGGGIDLFGRLLGRHLGQHLPGRPTVTVEDMPGAGGIRAANFLARQAPRDGTVMTTFAGGPVLEPLIGARNPGYDMSQFTWIGALARDVGLCLSWGPSPFKTIEDVRNHVMVVAGTGAGSETDTWPVIINEVLGTKFKVVTGYLGGEWNPVGEFIEVRQADAHAWGEVWLQGRGWTRVDPTAVVAPERLTRGMLQLMPDAFSASERLLYGPGWLGGLLQRWEAASAWWADHVVRFDYASQLDLLTRLGIRVRAQHPGRQARRLDEDAAAAAAGISQPWSALAPATCAPPRARPGWRSSATPSWPCPAAWARSRSCSRS